MSDATARLTEPERLGRVAEILCGAILRTTAGTAIQDINTESATDGPLCIGARASGGKGSEEERIIHYLRLMRAASPVDIRGALGLSRSTTWRVLQRLAKAGRVVGTGHTRQLMYQLNSAAPSADQLWRN